MLLQMDTHPVRCCHSHLCGSTPSLQVLARLAANNAKQQLAFRLCLNNISQCVANPIMAAKLGLQLYPMAVSRQTLGYNAAGHS